MVKKKKINQWADEMKVKINENGRWLYELTYKEDKERITCTDDFATPHGAYKEAIKKQKQIFKRNNYGTEKIKP